MCSFALQATYNIQNISLDAKVLNPLDMTSWSLVSLITDFDTLQAEGAADTAIEICILIGRLGALWEEVYPRYAGRGLQGMLLERLLPHLLASRLPSLPPEVMQVQP